MRILNRDLHISITLSDSDDSLIGLHYWKGVTECCSDEIDILDIGVGLFKVTITSQNY